MAVSEGAPPRAELTTTRRLVETSLERIGDLDVHLYQDVARRFFALSEPAEDLFDEFGHDRMAEMLFETLTAAVELLSDEPWAPGQIAAMGRRHEYLYHVPEGMYAAWSEAIVQALRDASGAEWDPETERAWRRSLQAVNDIMCDGARRERRGSGAG